MTAPTVVCGVDSARESGRWLELEVGDINRQTPETGTEVGISPPPPGDRIGLGLRVGTIWNLDSEKCVQQLQLVGCVYMLWVGEYHHSRGLV